MIYLMRHGEIDTGPERTFVGQRDIPLNANGEAQARYWHDALAGIEFSAIFCSDLSRTRQTAGIIAGDRGLAIREMPELREIRLGEWEGVPVSEIRARYPDQWRARGEHIATYRTPGGESFADMQARTASALEQIARMPGNLLIVAHAGVNRTLLCHVLGMPLENMFRLRQAYACLNLLEKNGGMWQVVCMNRSGMK